MEREAGRLEDGRWKMEEKAKWVAGRNKYPAIEVLGDSVG
jgi:hypothetical protein